MKKLNLLCAATVACCGASGLVNADLISYWPLDETEGTSVANTVATGTAGEIYGSDLWTLDDVRGQVLELDGATYVEAGYLPEFDLENDFTWSFWANSYQTANNNIIIGNRYPDEGWSKFTTASFEFRDIGGAAELNATMDYADFATDTWVHHVVVKQGPLFTYYRDGLMRNRIVITSIPDGFSVPTPFYFGGDLGREFWAGRLDDVAFWNNALPVSSIASLARDVATPATVPLTPALPAELETIFSDDFSAGLDKWTVSDRGLESTAASTYDAPAITDGAVVLGGSTEAQYWLGSSLESTQAFDSRIFTEVSVKRVSLDGAGSAYRSSLWIFGDDGHFLHFSQNVGETGWQYNANDVGGSGTLNVNGSGNALPGINALGGDQGEHVMSVRVVPVGSSGVNMEMLIDGVVYGVHGFSNFPPTFRVILTGQARAAGDFVSAVFDDVVVRREKIENLPPSFASAVATASAVVEGGSLNFNAAALASDPENGLLTFSKISGPEWVSVSPEGVVSGTAPNGGAGFASVVVRVTDNAPSTADLTLNFRVQPASLPEPTLYGWWPLKDGEGDIVEDVSGSGHDGTITNWEEGGLGEGGSVWVTDPEYGTVLSFNGNDESVSPAGAYVIVGDPFALDGGPLPELSLDSNFAWSFWAKPNQAANNDIIIGNRYNPDNTEYSPREFVKFTGSAFEWHHDTIGENITYTPLPSGAWHHHVAIKEGSMLYYYRDGVFMGGREITGAPVNALPLYFGGQGVENWAGWMVDVRLFNGTLAESAVSALFAAGPSGAVTPPTPKTFNITNVTRGADGALTIEWQSEQGKSYQVQWSTSLATGQWHSVGNPVVATESSSSFTLPAGGSPDPATVAAGFLRVIVPAP